MKPYFLLLILLPLLLVGCAPSGYVSDYPVYAGPGYYDPGYYYAPPPVTVSYYNGGYYHGYHHYSNAPHRSYASNVSHTSYHGSGGPRVASTSHVSSTRHTTAAASSGSRVSSRQVHQ